MSVDELDDPSPRDWLSYPDALEFVVQHFGSVRRAFAKLHAGLVSEAVRSLRGLDQGDKFVPLPADAWREGGDIEVKLTIERRGSRQVLGETWREDDLEIIWREFELLDHDLVLLSREDVERLCGLPAASAPKSKRKPAVVTSTDPVHEKPHHPGGRPVEINWEGAAKCVDDWVGKHGLFPRYKDGRPNLAPAIKLMAGWLKDNDPPPVPDKTNIRRWINNNLDRCQWWKPKGQN